jgi:hypothetical protein
MQEVSLWADLPSDADMAGQRESLLLHTQGETTMNRVRIGLLLAIALAAGLLLAAGLRAPYTAAAGVDRCPIAGSWVSHLEAGPEGARTLVMQETFTPLDPAAKRLAYVLRVVNPSVTFFSEYPLTDYASELVGEAVRTEEGTYDLSAIGYGVRTEDNPFLRNEIQYIWIIEGSTECTDANAKTSHVSISVYDAVRDGDNDGFPDQGQEPDLHIPRHMFGTARRVH